MSDPSLLPPCAFGPFVFDRARRRLLREGEVVPITGRALDILGVLVEHAGRPVGKELLLDRVWGDVSVEEGNLARNVSTLRRFLGDDTDQPQYIATLAGRGYQFVAPVRPVSTDPGRAEDLPAILPPVMSVLSAPSVPSAPSVAPAPTPHRRLWLPLIAAGAALAIGAAVWFAPRAPQPTAATDGPLRLAVLPFQNLTGDAGQEFFADGLTEEMIAQMARLNPSRLTVIARTSSMSLKTKRPAIDEVSRLLDVDYVVEGSARKVGDRIRITAQLIEVKRQTPVWSQSYDRTGADVLLVQQDVAAAIAREIRIELTPDAAAHLGRIRAVNLDAHRSYVEGRHYLSLGTEADIHRATERFEAAIASDPGYAPPHTGLADAAIALTDYYVSPDQTRDRAHQAAQRAVELDDTLAEGHTTLGVVHTLFDWDWPGAEREFTRAIALQPGNADAHMWYGYYLALMGRTDEAVAETRLAEALDPLSVAVQLNSAWIFYLAHRPDEALAHANRALALDSHAAISHASLWVAYAPFPEFVANAKIDPAHATALGLASLAGAAAMAGDRPNAERLLEQLKTSPGYVCPYEMASAYAALNRRDEAFRYLERSYTERSPCLPDLKADPRFENLRSDERFPRMLERLKLPQ